MAASFYDSLYLAFFCLVPKCEHIFILLEIYIQNIHRQIEFLFVILEHLALQYISFNCYKFGLYTRFEALLTA